jgi:hypothetical protein
MPRATHRLLIPLAAFLAVLPMILHGGSCGHDMVFHVQGWFDAAAQLRHGHYPHWSFTSAWNAGEPRFLFYPPLSWLLGAFLTLTLPPNAAVYAFIFVALTAAGLSFYQLAGHFTTPNAALLASAFYLANPYMLFNAFERSAFAELLAAAWIPLLLLAVLRRRPTIPSIAVPLALLWLTNAPAAVIGSYTLALLASLRVAHSLRYPGVLASGLMAPKRKWGFSPWHASTTTPYSSVPHPLSAARLTLTYILGTLLGLALPAFYLIPAAYERRFIQVEMAIIPTMRIQDNFLFTPTQDPGHNGVNLQISLLAITLLALTLLAVAGLWIIHSRAAKNSAPLLEIPSPSHETNPQTAASPKIALTVLAAALILMLLPISTPIWNHLPELQYLQFPWRLLTLLSAVLALTLALLLRSRSAPDPSAQNSFLFPISSFLLPALLGFTAFHLYAQFCQPTDRPPSLADQLATHHGFPPTDEYTPNNADSDVLRTTNPAFWLIPANANPNTPAPNTQPTAVELDPSIDTDDTVVPLPQRISTPAPTHFDVMPHEPSLLILNLRDYPNWDVSTSDECSEERYQHVHIARDDGLIAIPLYCGALHTTDITWRTTLDQKLGVILSIFALLILVWLSFRTPPDTTQIEVPPKTEVQT